MLEEVNATCCRYDFFNDTLEQEIANLSYGLIGSVTPLRKSSTTWQIVMRFVCDVSISFPVAVAGILGNALTIFVLFHYKPAMTTTIIMRWLALNNSLSLAANIFLRSLRYAGLAHYHSVFPYIFFWMFPTNYAIRLTDAWLTVLLTFDRYIAVCYPLQASRLCSRTRTKVAVFVIFVSAYLFSLPRYFEYVEINHSASSISHKDAYLLTNPYYNFIYCIALFFVVMYLIPMAVVTLLNSKLLVTFRQSATQRATDLRMTCGAYDATSAYKRTITSISIVIILVAVVTDTFAMTSHSLTTVNKVFPGHRRLDLVSRVMANVGNVLITVRCAVNFLIYCVFSRQFRSVLARTCRRRKSPSMRSRSGSRQTGSSLSSKISESKASVGNFGTRVLARITDRIRTMHRPTQSALADERSLGTVTSNDPDVKNFSFSDPD